MGMEHATTEYYLSKLPSMEPYLHSDNISTTLTINNAISVTQSTFTCRFYVLFMRTIMGIILLVTGGVGNLLIVIIFWSERNKSSTLFLLICLSLADIGVLVLCSIYSLPHGIFEFMGENMKALSLTYFTLIYLSAPMRMLTLTSNLLIVVVTWHRYVSVCLPHQVKKLASVNVAKIQVICIVVFSVIFNCSRWFHYEMVNGTIIPTEMYKTEEYRYIYEIFLSYLFYYILPILALIYMTVELTRKMRLMKFNINKQGPNSDPYSEAKQEITKSLIVVVIVFIICQFFAPAHKILLSLYPNTRSCGGILYYSECVVLLASILNSAINFIIFMLCAKRLRRTVKELFMKSKSSVAPATVSRILTNSSSPANTSHVHS